jgi:hypothetical protein
MENKTVTVLEIEVDEPKEMILFWFNELAEVKKEGEEKEGAHASISIDDLQSIVVPNGLQSYSGAELEYDLAQDALGWKIVNARLKPEEKETDGKTGPGVEDSVKSEHTEKSYKDETISAFAYNAGKKIEEMINNHNDNLSVQNQHMEAKILSWYRQNGQDPKFAEHFGIQAARSGSM